MALLEVRSLSKYFGGLAAVDGVSMEANRGEVLGLVGPNGAGKTTLFNLVTGFLRPTRGKVMFKGEDITGLKPNRIAEKGMVRTFQAANTLFQTRTVWENVLIACHLQFKAGLLRVLLNTPFASREEQGMAQTAAELIESASRSSKDAGSMPGIGHKPGASVAR